MRARLHHVSVYERTLRAGGLARLFNDDPWVDGYLLGHARLDEPPSMDGRFCDVVIEEARAVDLIKQLAETLWPEDGGRSDLDAEAIALMGYLRRYLAANRSKAEVR